ncbi:MAG TPA: class I SAM-dependent methyltransferase [Salegentibacter sp.]|uniref:class I SAM-dependent methyltransferase n=1 Tax=Salegentibacter sp. TaxID=1903072 RepID=UPI002F93827D
MNKALLKPEIQKFIRENLKSDLTGLVLKGSPFPEVSSAEIAMQISGLKTAQNKLPTWFETPNIYYPPKLNLEQTSSEITAKYKASLIQGKQLIDLSGGFGIDDHFFAESFKEVIYCELNGELAEIARHNFKQLKKDNIQVIPGDGIKTLEASNNNFDVIYADPARRDDHGGKVFKLADCLPDIPTYLDLLFRKTDRILIKTSPLLDITAGLTELKHVSAIHIVAVTNEVKELLWFMIKDFSGSPQIKTINFNKSQVEKFSGSMEDKPELKFSFPKKYLYEPNAAIMKSRLFELLAEKTGTSKLHKNSHLFTSEKLKEFPGRIFEIIDIKYFKPTILKKEFKGSKANITTRNFPESVADLRKLLRIKDGGERYLFFTTNQENKKLVIDCRKILN